ncbi:hypothetical protein OTAKU_00290 [Serratia phage vB_SmaM-Otaku]|uniref:Uncharacterized protein n=1 Tax=Serratia phage vB_SmaM-Otaku TaxID=2932867 RepID=A0AAE9KS11_9CAUD|nr:hypothetical protein PF631_gp29 [Serratia phage vB_SmaM-Otaku]UPU16018.1 hypothetical protein OTAKU_00290 [Serratia phage vB_SmaM-Otaku]
MTIIEMIKNLAQRNSVVASADVLAVFAELEAKDNHIAELETKLATLADINLPARRDDSYDWDGASPSGAFNTCRSICGLMFRQQLRAAGFTVEGDA